MESTCKICGAHLSLINGEWWDDAGWKGDAFGGHPWHLHEPVEED